MNVVVIVTYNSADDIERCLASIDPAIPVVILDNASTDGTAEATRRDTGIVVGLKENLGYTVGANAVAKIALDKYPDAETITFLNPDTVCSPGWLDRMAAILHANPDAAAVGPVSTYVAGRQKYQVWLPPNDPRASGGFEGISEVLAEANAGRARETMLLIGFCLMVRRSDWDELGPFHEGCNYGLEDLEWSLRARRAGKRLLDRK